LLELSTHLQSYGNVIDDQVQDTMMALTMLKLEWELLIVSSKWSWVAIILLGMELMVIDFVVFSNLLDTQTKISDGYTRLWCVMTAKVPTLTLDGAL
jgi:hypothetical protein